MLNALMVFLVSLNSKGQAKKCGENVPDALSKESRKREPLKEQQQESTKRVCL